MRDGDDRAIEIRSDHLSKLSNGCVERSDTHSWGQTLTATLFTSKKGVVYIFLIRRDPSTSSLLNCLVSLCIQSAGCLCTETISCQVDVKHSNAFELISPHQEVANHQTPGTKAKSFNNLIFQVFLDFVSTPAVVVSSRQLNGFKWHELLHHNKQVCHKVMEHPAAAARHGRGKGVAVRPRSSCRHLLRPDFWWTSKNRSCAGKTRKQT